MPGEKKTAKNNDRPTTVGGIRAVELFYRVIRDISSGQCAFYQSQTRLNTPNLGTLMPENFRIVSEITRQCVNLFEVEFVQALEAIEKFNERDLVFNWVSVYMPSKLLRESIEKKLLDSCDKYRISTSKVCFALSESLLEETDTAVRDNIKRLRNRGFHFMLTDFGSVSSPIMKLSEFEVDHVMMSPEVTQYIGRDQRADQAVHALVDFISGLGAEALADGVSDSTQAEALYQSDCRYCAGTLSGRYMAERYVRRRSEE